MFAYNFLEDNNVAGSLLGASIVANVLGTTNVAFIYDNATNGFNCRDRYIYGLALPNMGNGSFNARFGPPGSNDQVTPEPSGFHELDTNVVSTAIRQGNFSLTRSARC